MIVDAKCQASPLVPIDVICQHNSDGNLIPLRIRTKDDEGDYHAYTIHKYRLLDLHPGSDNPDRVELTLYDIVYECHAYVFGRDRMFRIYYDLRSTSPVWQISRSCISSMRM